jgi:hypothetical protein
VPEGGIPGTEEEPGPAVYAVLRCESAAPGPVSCLTARYPCALFTGVREQWEKTGYFMVK